MCEFDKQIQCQRAYLVHIGEEYIRQVKKRLRELGSQQHDKLHKYKLQFKYTAEDRLLSLTGEGLVKKIREYIPSTLENYVEQKKNLLQTVGYEDGGYKLNFTVTALPSQTVDPLERLVDFTLGLTPYIEADHVEISDIRFGIEAPEAKQILSGGRLEILDREEHAQPATILIYTEDRLNEVRLDVKLHTPTGFGIELSPQYRKFRFAVPFIEFITIIGTEFTGSIKLSLPELGEMYDLNRIQSIAKLIILMNEANSRRSQVEFEIRIASASFGRGKMFLEFNGGFFDEHSIRAAQVIDYAYRIAKQFDIHHDTHVRVRDLLVQFQRLELVAQVLERIPHLFRITYKVEEVPQDSDFRICMPMVFDVLLGKYRPVVSFAVIGQPSYSGTDGNAIVTLEVITQDARVCYKRLLEQKENASSIMRNMLRQVVEKYRLSMLVLLTPDVARELEEDT